MHSFFNLSTGKKLGLAILFLLAAGAGIYWYAATEKFADTKDRNAAFSVTAADFMHEFNTNDSLANKKYTDQIVTVVGKVSAVEPADTTVNIKFIDSTSGTYVIFAFQEQHVSEAKSIRVGDSISVKGSCSGSIFSTILGSRSISFKRCALTNKK